MTDWLDRARRLDRVRAGWLALGLATLALLLLPLVLGEVEPDIGVETRMFNGVWIVDSISPGSVAAQAGLRPLDEVVALDGAAPTLRRLTSPSLNVRAVHTWRVLRGGRELDITVDPDSAPLTTRLEPLVLLALALVFWGSALGVVLSRPADMLATRYARLSLVSAIALALSSAAAGDSLWAKPLEVMAFAVMPAYFYAFCTALADQKNVGATRHLQRGLMSLGILSGALYLLGGYAGSELYDDARGLLLALLAVASVGGLMAMLRAYWRPPSPRARQQVQIIVTGAAIGVLPLVLLGVLPELFGQAPILRPQLAVLAEISLPLAVTYAIVRHHFLDIHVVLSRTLVYVVMALLLAACYAVVLEGFNRLRFGDGNILPPAVAVVFFGGVTLSFIPVHSRLRRFIDQLVYRDRYNHVDLVQAVGAQLASAGPTEQVLHTIAEELMRSMNLEGAAILLLEANGRLEVRATSGVCAAPEWRAGLAHIGIETAVDQRWDPLGSGLWLPLVSHEQETGLLYLGCKRNRTPLRAADLSVAQTIASHAATATSNSILVERLRLKVAELELLRDRLVRAEEEERQRLAQDLHDSVLHTVLNVVRQASGLLEMVEQDHLPIQSPGFVRQLREVAERASDAAHELRAACSDLYPSELEHLGVVPAIERLVDSKRLEDDVAITFSAAGFPPDRRLPSDIEDAVYRAAREALDNVSRHAEANRASVQIELDESSVILTVTDDGQGFEPTLPSVALLQSGHFGVATMRDRAERLAGSLEIISRAGEGTRVELRLPLVEQGVATPV